MVRSGRITVPFWKTTVAGGFVMASSPSCGLRLDGNLERAALFRSARSNQLREFPCHVERTCETAILARINREYVERVEINRLRQRFGRENRFVSEDRDVDALLHFGHQMDPVAMSGLLDQRELERQQ